MERRSELRFEIDRPVRVTELESPPISWTGTVRNLSGRGMRLTVPQAISPGTAIRVDADNIMFLGDVCYCVPENPGYSVGLIVEHIVTGLDELERLNRSLFGEVEVERPVSPAAVSQPQACSPR